MKRLTWLLQRRIVEIAFFPTRTTHQYGVYTLARIFCERWCTLGCLIIGMSVHGQQAETLIHSLTHASALHLVLS